MEKCERCGKDTEGQLHYVYGKKALGVLWRFGVSSRERINLCENCMKGFKVWLTGNKK